MTGHSKDDALTAAVQLRWEDAIQINLELLQETPDDSDTINRLAFAYSQTGNTLQALKEYKRVLTIDPYNLIAKKNIERLKSCATSKKKEQSNGIIFVAPDRFLEEPGKTKIVDCVNIAPTNTIVQLHSGEELVFKSKKHGVELRRKCDNTYVGALPDDIAFRINHLISAGNTYCVHVKSMSKNCISVFIRELSRAKTLKNQPSFIGKTSYIPYSHEDTREKPDVSETGAEATDDQED